MFRFFVVDCIKLRKVHPKRRFVLARCASFSGTTSFVPLHTCQFSDVVSQEEPPLWMRCIVLQCIDRAAKAAALEDDCLGPYWNILTSEGERLNKDKSKLPLPK